MFHRVASVLVAAALLSACGQTSHPSSATSSNPTSVDRLNKLIRNELAAVESYKQAIEKAGSESQELVSIRGDHQGALGLLRSRVTALGGTASTDSGVWGDFAK